MYAEGELASDKTSVPGGTRSGPIDFQQELSTSAYYIPYDVKTRIPFLITMHIRISFVLSCCSLAASTIPGLRHVFNAGVAEFLTCIPRSNQRYHFGHSAVGESRPSCIRDLGHGPSSQYCVVYTTVTYHATTSKVRRPPFQRLHN